ncbi:MAG: hypothetical protein Q8R28_06955 [Dehalococcoidia bacterium]|nr:hypothetical protein [Dehalococcoidia bacterium]
MPRQITVATTELVSFTKAAKELGVGRTTLHNWVTEGHVEAFRDPDTGRLYFLRSQMAKIAARIQRNAANPRKRVKWRTT